MTQPVSNGMNDSGRTDSDVVRTVSPPGRSVHDNSEQSAPGDSIPTPRPQSAPHAVETSDPAAAAIYAAVGENHFRHWFSNRSRFQLTDDCLRIFVSNPFISNWLLKRFRSALNSAAVALLGPSGSFELQVDESLAAEESITVSDTKPSPHHSAAAQKSSTAAGSATVSANFPGDGPQPLAVRPANRRRFRSFAGLISGDCNDLALMASRQVAEYPGERFNPLYLHGPTGVGKTHLLEAIYTDIRRNHSGLNVVCLTSESFTNYFTQALSSKTVPSFRQKFRNVDVLLIDNIEFLDNRKKATEEEFLHTIVQVIENGGQLVVTGDRHPRLLTRHREDLTTRFMSGLVCRIDVPCEETRRRIAASLALPMKGSFTQETIAYVAHRCRRSVREIQGALNCLHGHFSLTGRRITVGRAREILGEMEDECRRLVRISDVEKVICDAFGVTMSDLRSRSRRRAIACPRSLAMYVARKLTKCAYREIGLHFGGRDHSTVVAAEKRVQRWISDDTVLDLPSSCRGRTIAEVVHEIEERLLSLAS